MKVLCEFWCSPFRREIYSENFILLEGTDESYVLDEIKEFYTGAFGDFWFDVFGENTDEIKGLFRVVIEVDVNWEHNYDWEGIPDTETKFNLRLIFKGQCACFSEVKWKWLELSGKLDWYNNKVLNKLYKEFDVENLE